MRYGVGFNMKLAEQVALSKNAGFDFVECGFQSFVFETQEVRDAFRNALQENEILCESANCFLPGDMKIIGTDYARGEMREFIETGMARGKEMGLEIVVFGSSGARKLPDDVPFPEGIRQIAAFLREVVSPIAAKHDMIVAIEPLRKEESNIIHTLETGVLLSSLVDRKNISVLADNYHMVGSLETMEGLRQMKGQIVHGHISNPTPGIPNIRRTYPMDESEWDYKGFVDALEAIGCKRCCIEAHSLDFPTEVEKSAALLKRL